MPPALIPPTHLPPPPHPKRSYFTTRRSCKENNPTEKSTHKSVECDLVCQVTQFAQSIEKEGETNEHLIECAAIRDARAKNGRGGISSEGTDSCADGGATQDRHRPPRITTRIFLKHIPEKRR